MAGATTMTYGGYNISPVPLITIKRNYKQVANRDLPLGYEFEMNLSGTLTPLPNGATGIVQTENLLEELREAFNRDGKLLEIKCDAQVVLQCYPRIDSIDVAESNNNWVETIPFTITLRYDEDEFADEQSGNPNLPYYIEDYSEEWQMEFAQEHRYYEWDLSTLNNQDGGGDYGMDSNHQFEARVTHTVSAKGKQSWGDGGSFAALTGTSVSAANNAINWLNNVFGSTGYGYDATSWGHSLSGWNNLPSNTGEYAIFDHFRSHTINESDGSAQLTETWIVQGVNSGLNPPNRKIAENFTVNIRTGTEDGRIRLTVEGEIQGLSEYNYGAVVAPLQAMTIRGGSTNAYANASLAWNQIQNRAYPRAQYIHQQESSLRLNPTPVSRTVGHNPHKGIINYSYEFDTRPCAFITGSLSENFTIVDNNPTDVFATLTVLGRAPGPILQDISTVTESTREVTIEAVMSPPTGCTSITDLDLNKPDVNVKNLLCEFEQQLTGSYSQVFKNSDTENWNPLTGRYSRTVGWTYADCSGNINTSMC